MTEVVFALLRARIARDAAGADDLGGLRQCCAPLAHLAECDRLQLVARAAGPAGLVGGVDLWSTVLVEEEAVRERVGRGDAVDPEGLQHLRVLPDVLGVR